MDENSTSQQNEKKNSTGMILGTVGLVVILVLIGLWFVNRSSIDQLSRQLSQTQNQVENVQRQTQETRGEVAGEMQEGAGEIAQAIDNIDNPAVRLAVAKAYANKIQSTLDAASKEDLNTIIVYVERNPAVLVKRPAQWPAEVQEAITNLKTKLANVRTSVATSVQNTKDAVQAKVNDLVTLTGNLEFVSDDSVLGGSVFVMTTTANNRKYYFEFNETTSEQIKDTMLGKEVSIRIKVTGIENGHITYDVVSGPTLVSATPSSATGSGAMTQ